MITRIWHGQTRTDDATEYRQYVIDTGMKEYINTPGNLGAQIWQRQDGEVTDIWTVSWWKDYESIKLFAGEDFQKAHYFDGSIAIVSSRWQGNGIWKGVPFNDNQRCGLVIQKTNSGLKLLSEHCVDITTEPSFD